MVGGAVEDLTLVVGAAGLVSGVLAGWLAGWSRGARARGRARREAAARNTSWRRGSTSALDRLAEI